MLGATREVLGVKMSSPLGGEGGEASLTEVLDEGREGRWPLSLAGPEAGGLLGVLRSPGFGGVRSGIGSPPV